MNVAVPFIFAGKAAIDAAKHSNALDWEGAASANVPDGLRTDLKSILILQLPKVFESVGYRIAARFMRAWQFGSGVLLNKSVRYGSYVPIKIADFQTSENVNEKVAASLANFAYSLPSMEGEAIGDEKWSGLRKRISQLIKDKGGKDGSKEWDITTNLFSSNFSHPEVSCGFDVVSEYSYLPDEQMSDAMGALGAFALDKFLRARIRRDANKKIYVTPLQIAVRIRDSYDFTDSSLRDFLSGVVLTGKASQYLGSYIDKNTGESVSLTNSDFVRFREEFRKKYNEVRGRRPELICKDFSIYSDFHATTIDPVKEYPVVV